MMRHKCRRQREHLSNVTYAVLAVIQERDDARSRRFCQGPKSAEGLWRDGRSARMSLVGIHVHHSNRR